MPFAITLGYKADSNGVSWVGLKSWSTERLQFVLMDSYGLIIDLCRILVSLKTLKSNEMVLAETTAFLNGGVGGVIPYSSHSQTNGLTFVWRDETDEYIRGRRGGDGIAQS